MPFCYTCTRKATAAALPSNTHRHTQGGQRASINPGINAQAVPLADASAITPRLPSCLPAHVTATRATHPAPRLPPHLQTNAPNGLATIIPPTAARHHTHHSRQARRLHEALQASPAPGPECRVTCSEAPSCWPRLPTHHGASPPQTHHTHNTPATQAIPRGGKALPLARRWSLGHCYNRHCTPAMPILCTDIHNCQHPGGRGEDYLFDGPP
jgi:hypothetical protein